MSDLDKINSIFGGNDYYIELLENLYNIKLDNLRKIKPYLLNNNYIVYRGIDILNIIINYEFKKLGLRVEKINNAQVNNINEKNFYIVDTYGELNLFFKLSHAAIVGGSFKKIGGHNPIEISNYDCVLFFGPEMFNFNQIKEIILKKKAGFEVNSHEDLTKKIILILDNKKLKEQTIINFKKLCKEEALKVKKMLKNFSM